MKFDLQFLIRCREFGQIWIAELISVLGSELTRFAVPVWIYESTNSASAVTIASVAAFIPRIALGFFAGALVDQWPSKRSLVVAEIGQAFGTALILLGIAVGWSLWTLYIGLFISSVFATLDYPAMSAATVQLVKKEDFAKANGMLELTASTGLLLAPVIAGSLYPLLNIKGLVGLDLLSFVFGIVLLIVTPFREERKSRDRVTRQKKNLWKETVEVARYICVLSDLYSTLIITTAVNFFFSMSYVLITPMILSLTANNTQILGIVMAVSGGGQLLGTSWIGFTGGPQNKIRGFIYSTMALGVFGPLVIGLSNGALGWGVGLSITMILLPVITSSSRTIWQEHIPKEMIGRAFAFRRTVSSMLAPLGFLGAGVLAEKVFEPMLSPPKGSGYKACFIVAGIGITMAGVYGLLSPGLKRLDATLKRSP